MKSRSNRSIRLDCEGSSVKDILGRLEEALADAREGRRRPVIVLLHLTRLQGSVMSLLKELTRLVMRSEPRGVLVDGSGFAGTFLETLPGAVPIVVCNEEPGSDDPRRVLVVEDHEDILEFLCNLIRSAGHDCSAARTLADAKRLLAEESFDLVLLDLALPDGDGLDVARLIQEQGRPIPVIVASCHLDRFDPALPLPFGIRRAIPKPFRVREILGALQETAV